MAGPSDRQDGFEVLTGRWRLQVGTAGTTQDPGSAARGGARCPHAAQSAVQLKTEESFISGISHKSAAGRWGRGK